MEQRKVTVKKSAAERIAAIALFIEGKGLVRTSEKFSNTLYDFFIKLSDSRKSYPNCREPLRRNLGYKCVTYKKKYTIVFVETETEICICEFLSSKMFYW
jgi:plasmid stabilization system protein ParE